MNSEFQNLYCRFRLSSFVSAYSPCLQGLNTETTEVSVNSVLGFSGRGAHGGLTDVCIIR